MDNCFEIIYPKLRERINYGNILTDFYKFSQNDVSISFLAFEKIERKKWVQNNVLMKLLALFNHVRS